MWSLHIQKMGISNVSLNLLMLSGTTGVQHGARLDYALSPSSLSLPHNMPYQSTNIPVKIPVRYDIILILGKFGEMNWSALSSPRLGCTEHFGS
jgi:hypothetical protein